MGRWDIIKSIFVIVGLMAAAGAALFIPPAIQNPTVEDKQIKDLTLDKIGDADDRLIRVIGRNESSINRAINSTDMGSVQKSKRL